MKRLTFLTIIGCVACNAWSYEPESELLSFYGDEDFISIATGSVKPIAKAPAVASIITYEDMLRLGVRDIDDVLETVPGLHVSRAVIGNNPIYTFRGIYSGFNPQVLMLINGIPITNLNQGDRNQAWGGMPIEMLSRVEIIRGPGSALYGADAFAGVINIITKSGAEIGGTKAGYRQGSFNTRDAWILYGEELDSGTEIAFSIEYSETDGHDEKISADAQTFLDSVFLTNVSLAPEEQSLELDSLEVRFEIKGEHLTFRAGYQGREGGSGAGVSQALDPSSRISSDRYNVDLSYTDKDLINGWALTAQVSALQTSQEVEEDLILFPAGSTGPFMPPLGIFPEGVIGNPEVFERHYRTSFDLESTDLTNHQLRFGAGYYLGDVYKTEESKNFGINPNTGLLILPGEPLVDVSDTPFVFLPEDDRENKYVYLQDVWHFSNDWELTVGVRYDDYSDFGSTTNPRAALVWSARHDLTVKALYGEAFRAPSFAETRVSSNPAFLGNPDLDPETIKSYELAFDYQPRHDLNLKANIFSYKWEDIIQFVPEMGGVNRAQNTGEQTGHGLELEVSWDATDDLTLSGNFAWQKSTDENLDADAANSPEKQLYARADWQFAENWRLNVQANWVMDRNRALGDPRADIDDYVLVDLTLRRTQLWKNWEMALLVKNLFDEDAREPSPNGSPVPFIPEDLPLAGRSLLGEIRYQF